MEKTKEYLSLIAKIEEEFKNLPDKVNTEPYNLSAYKNPKTIKILKEIDEKHNHSWIKEIWLRRKNNLDDKCILYRGEYISYGEFFVESYKLAKALKKYGIKKYDEFICCIENTPEFPFIMGAASMIGAKVNLVSGDIDPDYLKDIINSANTDLIFASDMSFAEFANGLIKTSNKHIITIDLERSLKKGNPYKELIEQYYQLDNEKYQEALSKFDKVNSYDELIKFGEDYDGNVLENTGLNDEFTVTYTSGSTLSNKPSGLIHRVRSYITMGRYHDREVSGIPTMKGRITLALVRTMSDTDFMSGVSDTFMQGGVVALEPVNIKEFILESILINKPTLALTSRSVWLYAMKRQQNNECYKNIKFPSLFVPTAIGEPLDANEEKALNKWFRKMKAGVDVTKTPKSIVCMSIAGGDSEHGGIFLKLFRSLQSKKLSHLGIDEPVGMGTYDMVEIAALREDGTYCNPMEPGRLVANSPCTMKSYNHNPEKNKEFWITSADGKQWANLNTYGYIDKCRNVYVKGRISKTDLSIPNYAIANEILKDTKKILSCEVVITEHEGKKVYVAHIEPQMNTSFN